MIRKAENTNILVDIWLRASLEAHAFIASEYWYDNEKAMRDHFLPSSDNYVYKTEKGEILGFISLSNNFIEALFVDPAHQGKGIGKALLNHAKSLSRKLKLSVFERNRHAVDFYLRNDFMVEARCTDPEVDEVELIMAWRRVP